MHIHNLEKNILFMICEELFRRNSCGPIEADFLFRAYSDIPDVNIELGIQSAIEKGWIRGEKNKALICLTARGHSEIRAFIQTKIPDWCELT